MSGRIVVFGATGYTGRLVTAALTERGARPVVAGRHADALQRLADDHGGLDVAVADVEDPPSVRALVEAGDVLVTTVGPFGLRGESALRAAVDAGAHYVDSAGEAAFVRHVARDAAPDAERSGSALLTAFGYDYVPGHLAAAAAMESAVAGARRLQVLYSGLGSGISSGTRASGVLMARDTMHRLDDGRLVERPTGRDVATFTDGDERRTAIVVGGTEPLLAPRRWPDLTDVSVWLELGPTAWAAKAASYLVPTLMRVPAIRERTPRMSPGSGEGPSAEDRERGTCTVTAIVSDVGGQEIARGQVRGPNAYDLTGTTMAAAAIELSDQGAPRAGLLGPLDLFDHMSLGTAAATLGLELA